MNTEQIRVLYAISKGAKTKGELCQRLRHLMDAKTRNGILAYLEKNGLVTVSKPITVKMGAAFTYLSITKKGREKVRELRKQGVVE